MIPESGHLFPEEDDAQIEDAERNDGSKRRHHA
jgi:hypothetical protein